MSILVNENTKVVVYGISGKYGSNQTRSMLQYGTKILAGITPGKGGATVHDVPVFDTLAEVRAAGLDVNTAIVYVPGEGVLDVVKECAADGKIKFIMIATEGVPCHDVMQLRAIAEANDIWVLGPNTIGIISPGKCLVGSLAPAYAKPGYVGVASRGGTITIETIRVLSEYDVGQTTCVGAGGDKVIGKNPVEYLKLFEADPETRAVVLIGEIGGGKENEAAEYIKTMTKPVFAYILGRTAPAGARMGHIGAIIGGASETFDAKREALRAAGATVVDTPWELAEKLKAAGFGLR